MRAQWVVVRGTAVLPATASCSGKAVRHTAAGTVPGFSIAEPTTTDDQQSGPSSDELLVSAASLVVACSSAPTKANLTVQIVWG